MIIMIMIMIIIIIKIIIITIIIINNNYSPKCQWLVVGIYRAATTSLWHWGEQLF